MKIDDVIMLLEYHKKTTGNVEVCILNDFDEEIEIDDIHVESFPETHLCIKGEE